MSVHVRLRCHRCGDPLVPKRRRLFGIPLGAKMPHSMCERCASEVNAFQVRIDRWLRTTRAH